MQILNEKYETIRALFNNPEFKNSNVYRAIANFQIDGGQVLGEGTFGIVLTRPEWNFVLKVFVRDDSYLRFVRFAIKNPRKSYPKFYDIPRRLKSDFLSIPDDAGQEKKIESIYVVKTEKLFPITQAEYQDIQFYLVYKTSGTFATNPPKVANELKRLERKYPSIEELNDDFMFAVRGITKAKKTDIKNNNIMKRKNGEFVFIDPFYDYFTATTF